MDKQIAVEMTECFGVQDIFVSGLGTAEDIGSGCFRFTFYARQHIGDRDELVVVAKLVTTADAVPPAVLLAAKAVGFSLISEVLRQTMN